MSMWRVEFEAIVEADSRDEANDEAVTLIAGGQLEPTLVEEMDE